MFQTSNPSGIKQSSCSGTWWLIALNYLCSMQSRLTRLQKGSRSRSTHPNPSKFHCAYCLPSCVQLASKFAIAIFSICNWPSKFHCAYCLPSCVRTAKQLTSIVEEEEQRLRAWRVNWKHSFPAALMHWWDQCSDLSCPVCHQDWSKSAHIALNDAFSIYPESQEPRTGITLAHPSFLSCHAAHLHKVHILQDRYAKAVPTNPQTISRPEQLVHCFHTNKRMQHKTVKRKCTLDTKHWKGGWESLSSKSQS